MLKGKWYKVFWKPNVLSAQNRSIQVWAFDFNSAAATAKIKVAQKNPLFSENNIVVTKIEKLSFDTERENFRNDLRRIVREAKKAEEGEGE